MTHPVPTAVASPGAATARWARRFLIGGLVATAAACGGGDGLLTEAKRAEIDAVVEQMIQAEGLPGTVVGVQVGTQRHVSVRGKADLASGRARAADDPFRIASVSKSFIGTAVLILVDRGELSTSDTIDRWYPSFPRAKTITVGDLLRMRSGIADSADMNFLETYWDDPLIKLTADDMIARAAARGSEFIAPNTVTRYTNVNFMLLERIVEKVSGTDIRSFLTTHIFQPLGLRNTSYPSDSRMPGALRGYGRASDTAALEDRTVVDPTAAGGAGALVSDLEDMMIYTKALCTGTLLKASTQARRLQSTALENEPDFIGYGEGLVRIGRFCGHNGTIFGFSTEVWYLPEVDATFVVSVNRLDRDDKSKSFNTFALVTRALFPNLVNW